MVEVGLEPDALTSGIEKTVKIIENRKKATEMLFFQAILLSETCAKAQD